MNKIIATAPTFDYGALTADQAAVAKSAAKFIGERHRIMSASVLEIGQRLIEVKERLGHGHFTAWVEAEFPMTVRTAQDYMLAAERLGPKNETASYLPTTTLINIAKAPEPVRDDILKRIDEAPLPAKAVNGILAAALDAEKVAKAEARKSPEALAKEKAREKARKQRWAREYELYRQKREAEQKLQHRAEYELAVLLIDRFRDDCGALILALEKAQQRHLADLVSNPYGYRWEGSLKVPNERPAEWDDAAVAPTMEGRRATA
jgi:hypothetical protein